MQIATPLSPVWRGRPKFAKRHLSARGYLIQIKMLHFLLRISVIEDPFIARQIRAMAIDGHYILPDNFNFIGLVLIEVELVSVRRVFSPRQNMTAIPPDEVRRAAIRIENEEVLSLMIRREHART